MDRVYRSQTDINREVTADERIKGFPYGSQLVRSRGLSSCDLVSPHLVLICGAWHLCFFLFRSRLARVTRHR